MYRFSQFGYSGLQALTSFASKKVGLSDLAILQVSFLFFKAYSFTFPVLIILTSLTLQEISVDIENVFTSK